MLQLKNIVKTYVTGDLRQDALQGVYGYAMSAYTELAPGVVEILYENGRGVCVNYNGQDYARQDGSVIPARGYLKLEGGEMQP